MGRPKMSDEEKAAAARKRARLRALGKLPPLGTQKRSKRLTKKRAARVKRGRPAQGPKAAQPVAARAPRAERGSVDQSVLAVSVGLNNLTVRVDQNLGQLQNAIIQANNHIMKLYAMLGQPVAGTIPMPAAVAEPAVASSPKAVHSEPHKVSAPVAAPQVNGETPKKKGRPALSEEEKARRAAEKANATVVTAEPIVSEPTAIKPVVVAPTAAAPKVISVPEDETFAPAATVATPQASGSSEDLGLD